MSEDVDARRWTAAMVEARLIESFEIDRRIPDPGPRCLEPRATDEHDGRRAMLDLMADVEPDDDGCRAESQERLLDTREDDDLASLFAGGFEFFATGVRRAGAARKKAEQEELDALIVDACEMVSDNPAVFRKICRAAEHHIRRTEERCQSLQRMFESLDWLVSHERDPETEKAREATLEWLRSGLPKDAFCLETGRLPLDFRRALRRYCEAVASRLGNYPPDRRPALDDRPCLVFGLDNIAAELARSPRTTVRMIEAGRLPVGEFFGELCADRRMLHPFRETHRSRQIAALDAAA